MEQNPSEEKRFITNVLDLAALVHELATICWDAGRKDINPQLVSFAENYLQNYDPVVLIETFIKHSFPNRSKKDDSKYITYWDQIRSRNEIFFIENANTIFKSLPVDTSNINAFKLFFTAKDNNGNDIIVKDDRDAMWTIFESLVKICIKYIHRVKGYKLVSTEQGLRPAYLNNKFPYVKVREQAKLWKITLPIPGKE